MAKRLRGRFGYSKDDPFKVSFHPERLHEPSQLKKPSKIFVCSMGELFDFKSKYGWIGLVFAVIKRNPQHIFIILTKRPDVLHQFSFPENVWLGVSVDRTQLIDSINILAETDAKVKFVSFEPLLERITPALQGINWIIIGSQTGPRPFQPKAEWVDLLIKEARKQDCAVFLKNNLDYPEKIQEFPKFFGCD
jgi:protein gp37